MLKEIKEILIVDDETDFRLLLAELLVDEGYRVTTARNGEEALNLLMKTSTLPHLITIDINMPVKDGLTLKKEIRAIYPEIPVVFISGNIPIESEASDNSTPYLYKPLDRNGLMHTLQSFNN
jgi:two-component system, NtrC family, nitrogen regulation response regulator NtrX